MKIDNPLGFARLHISDVLRQLAAQENCDGSPYDQMVLAADYIRKLESRVVGLESRINGHNVECEETCKLWRDTGACSMRGYDRQCPECPKDWVID